MAFLKHIQVATLALAACVVIAAPASAKCTRLGFSVNDYGKEGPARDAKNLLDKYIADWAVKQGVKTYRTGKKDVKCELFLDFGVFDEYTCRAEATVCWGDNQPAGGASATAPAASTPKEPVAQKVKAAPTVKAPTATATKPEPAAGAPLQAPAPAKKKAE